MRNVTMSKKHAKTRKNNVTLLVFSMVSFSIFTVLTTSITNGDGFLLILAFACLSIMLTLLFFSCSREKLNEDLRLESTALVLTFDIIVLIGSCLLVVDENLNISPFMLASCLFSGIVSVLMLTISTFRTIELSKEFRVFVAKYLLEFQLKQKQEKERRDAANPHRWAKHLPSNYKIRAR